LVTRNRKIRHLRGSRTHGWGQVGQHRKSGSQGGSGNAGLHKHKWSWTVKYSPNHFGHQRLNPPGREKRETTRWINVGQLDDLYSSIRAQNPLEAKPQSPGQGLDLDLRGLGFQKLLAKGTVKGSYKITVPKFSESAKSKVEKAGGMLVSWTSNKELRTEGDKAIESEKPQPRRREIIAEEKPKEGKGKEEGDMGGNPGGRMRQQ
jgi:large subunit ribosomal protein L15